MPTAWEHEDRGNYDLDTMKREFQARLYAELPAIEPKSRMESDIIQIVRAAKRPISPNEALEFMPDDTSLGAFRDCVLSMIQRELLVLDNDRKIRASDRVCP